MSVQVLVCVRTQRQVVYTEAVAKRAFLRQRGCADRFLSGPANCTAVFDIFTAGTPSVQINCDVLTTPDNYFC
jgi:hypothetical protein